MNIARESHVTSHERVGSAGREIEVVRWMAAGEPKPPALLIHGTGFAAEVWDQLAQPLSATHSVIAIDRRGHGHSHKPAVDHYHFLDFAHDLCAVIEALGLTDIYGIGHSAGATDLLLAAQRMPDRFRQIFAMEPTAMRPPAELANVAAAREHYRGALEATARRRVEFESATIAYERFRSRPAFANWTEPALWSYLRSGFEALPDGKLRLLCTPEIEVAILKPIFEAMANVYQGDERGQPFDRFKYVACPVRISTSERSTPIYKRMASVAYELLPNASLTHFARVGHCAVQEAPDLVLTALRRFALGSR